MVPGLGALAQQECGRTCLREAEAPSHPETSRQNQEEQPACRDCCQRLWKPLHPRRAATQAPQNLQASRWKEARGRHQPASQRNRKGRRQSICVRSHAAAQRWSQVQVRAGGGASDSQIHSQAPDPCWFLARPLPPSHSSQIHPSLFLEILELS